MPPRTGVATFLSIFWTTYTLLGMAALFPLIMFTSLNIYLSLHTQREVTERDLRLEVAEIASDLDQELRSMFDQARIIADLPVFDRPGTNFDDLSQWVSRILQGQPRWMGVKIFDVDGNAVFVYGTTNSSALDPESFQQTVETKRPTMGALRRGASGKMGVPVRVPVIRNGKVLYVVTLVLSTDALSRMFPINLQPNWVASIVDRSGLIVARSENSESTIGRYSPNFSAILDHHQSSGTYTASDLTGTPVVGAFHHSSVSGWSVLLAMPKDVYDEPLQRMRLTLVFGGCAAVVLGAFFVLMLLRLIRQRQHEVELLAQKNRMESLGRLTSRVAHDFNNLLFIITANLELIESRLPGRPLRAIRDSTEKAAAMIRDLLSFSQGRPIEPVEITINSRVKMLVDGISETRSSDIKVVYSLAEPLPLINADAVQFDMSVMNLVVNACDAMETGGELSIHTWTEWHTGNIFVCLSIRDTGHGIPKHLLPRVFEPFFTTKPNDKGTGLGLAQVYSFVTTANGTIEVTTGKNGTAFTIRFPVKQAPNSLPIAAMI